MRLLSEMTVAASNTELSDRWQVETCIHPLHICENRPHEALPSLYLYCHPLFILNQVIAINTVRLFAECKIMPWNQVDFSGRLAIILVLLRTILEGIDDNYTIAIVFHFITIGNIIDLGIKTGIGRANKEHHVITSHCVKTGRHAFFISFAFSVRDGKTLLVRIHTINMHSQPAYEYSARPVISYRFQPPRIAL